jgi:hypothetical protein
MLLFPPPLSIIACANCIEAGMPVIDSIILALNIFFSI